MEWTAMAAAFVAVVAAGRAFSAKDVSAKTPTLNASGDATRAATSRNLLTLIGAEHMVRVDSRSGATVYTVCDRSGNVLAANLTQEQLGERFPALRLEDLHAQSDALMIADPRE
jgi:anti-sigma factor RsiW